MSDDKTPYILWHYTSIDTLIKICTNLTMRATHYKFMNDESELKLGIEEAKQQIKNNIFTNKNVQTLKYIEDELNKFADGANSREFYIISLSQERDKLSQWRSYTPSSGGCAIGFSTDVLLNVFEGYDSENMFLKECKYDTEKIAITAITAGLIDWNNKEFKRWIVQPICCTKHDCFCEEKEFRIVITRNSNTEVHFETEKPFIELKLNPSIFPDLIKEVVISPHGNSALNKQYVQFFSHYLGEKYNVNNQDGLLFSVDKSSLPYRNL